MLADVAGVPVAGRPGDRYCRGGAVVPVRGVALLPSGLPLSDDPRPVRPHHRQHHRQEAEAREQLHV